jgi:beta-1,4-mannosyltransferase
MQVLALPAFRTRQENPYNWLLYAAIQDIGVNVQEFTFTELLRQRYNIWHLHWPEMPLNRRNPFKAIALLALFALQVFFAKLRGTRIIWTVHNLKAHEGYYPKLEQWFWHSFTGQLDGFISLSQTGLEAARDRFPHLHKKPGFVIPHSHYRGEYPCQISRQDARQELGLNPDEKVLLFFGRIRDYKNVPQLIDTFRATPGVSLRLVIAGRPEASAAALIQTLAQTDPRIQLHLEFIPNDRAQVFFQAADLVVLPYREILNSGSALLALSFNCPVLVPNRGSMGELQGFVGSDWVQTFSELTPAGLIDALAGSQAARGHAPLEAFEGSRIAALTLEAYASLLSPR